MLTGNESLQELCNMREKLRSELERLHGSEKRMKESYLQDIDAAIEELKKRHRGEEVLY